MNEKIENVLKRRVLRSALNDKEIKTNYEKYMCLIEVEIYCTHKTYN